MSRPPNLLFLFTDEQRADTLACYGNSSIRMPNLNRLADESCVFESAYVTQPVCTPSRSTLLTGQYPHTNGCVANNIPLRPETQAFAEMLPASYRCAYHGKWHLGDEVVAQHGFPEWVSIEDAYRQYYSRPEYLEILSSYNHFLRENGLRPDLVDGETGAFSRRHAANLSEPLTKAGYLGGTASRFLEEVGDDPFCLFVNFLEPHMPFTGPLNSLYDPADLPVGPTFLQEPPADHAEVNRRLAGYYRANNYPVFDLSTEAGWRLVRAWYAGLCTQVDNAVGRILRTLESQGLDENTIVVFTSDHGDMMGDHALLTKCVLYEEAVKVPLLVRAPGMAPRRVESPVSHIDLVPTLLDLMEAERPAELEGESLRPVLAGERKETGRDVVVEWNARPEGGAKRGDGRPSWPDEEGNRIGGAQWRSIVSGGWKLNLSTEDRCELFDLGNDPHETTNRFDDPAERGRIREMTPRLRAWQEETADSVPLPDIG